jgi:3-hydroxyacyl-[acyl-carrier-protein] dehydratase
MAQAAAILSFRTMGIKPDDKSVYYFAGIDRARFKKPVMPGDQLVLEVSIERTVRNVVKYAGKAYVDETLVAEAELLCTLRPI